MGKIKVQTATVIDPITLIGYEAGVCWGADIESHEKNYKRGLDCLKANHGRTLEFPQIYLTIEGYSARVIRELYTHIGGSPTRLQASTRYIDYNKDGGFDYVVPPSIEKNDEAKVIYLQTMRLINTNCKALKDVYDIPNEDVANLLPLGMTTKIVLRTNLRNLIDMCHQRLCTRAYHEFRDLMYDILDALTAYGINYHSFEWKDIVNEYCKPKCEVYGYCPEKKGCGKKPPKEN